MYGNIFGPGHRSWRSGPALWPTLACRSGSSEIWSGAMAEVILALDLPRGADALRLLDRLPELTWVKVGSILMTREGPDLVRTLSDRGLKVFLDLKWHDIPNTVAGAVTAAREIGVSMATVHTLGGSAMLEAAAAAADGAGDCWCHGAHITSGERLRWGCGSQRSGSPAGSGTSRRS